MALNTGSKSGTTLAGRVAAMSGAGVLVAGDIMLDTFIYGEVERISPESPVPVLLVRKQNVMLGGAGNVLANLRGLGAAASLATVTGTDSTAAQVKNLTEALHVDTRGIIGDGTRPTTVKTRYLAGHQQLLRTDEESSKPVDREIEDRLIEAASGLMEQAKVVILSDYGKGLLTARTIREIIEEALLRDLMVLVDPKGRDYRKYQGASLVTPNRKELAEATGMPVSTDDEIVAAARFLIREAGIRAVLATRSQEGMSLIEDGAEPLHIATEAREVFDVSGAGDTVVATMAAALAAGAGLHEAAVLANKAAGIVVGKVGTAPVSASELAGLLETGETGRAGGDSRICGWKQARETVERWQAKGLKVGFTNGCFDIMHAGHVIYLEEARRRCDRLILGLNSDASVKRLKGSSRPVNDELARATVVSALEAVDLVVLFGDEETEKDMPVRLLETLRPDIHFKGGDYRIEQLPEAATVMSYGGKVEIMPLLEGKSTTLIIEKMKEG